MEGTILDIVHLTGILSQTETILGEVGTETTPRQIVDSQGNILVDSLGNILVDARKGLEVQGTLFDIVSFSANLSDVQNIQGSLSSQEEITASVSVPNNVGGTPYTGDYEVTPSNEIQVLNTNGKSMTDNVTINPIPSNYGLITWNGGFLTVS